MRAYSLPLSQMNKWMFDNWWMVGAGLCFSNCLIFHTPVKKEILKSCRYLAHHAMGTKPQQSYLLLSWLALQLTGTVESLLVNGGLLQTGFCPLSHHLPDKIKTWLMNREVFWTTNNCSRVTWNSYPHSRPVWCQAGTAGMVSRMPSRYGRGPV